MLAEGVETMEQFEVLRSYGCEMAQGHLFSKPVSVEHASALLEYGSWPSEFMA
jgi:EAL domain-containing protein (putative c-di-GMP-specific phosphodiesterase class I)